jgi:chromosome segregation ATPase
MVKALAIADKELPYLEEKCELLKIENNDLESKKQQSKNELHNLKDEIASSKELLKSYTSSCERKRQESESVNNEISRLEALVTRFKSNNEEYLEIKSTVEDILKNVLTDGKVLLHKAVFSIIETLQNENNTTKNHLISFLAKEAITVSYYRDYKYVSSTSTSSSGEHKLAQYIEDYKDTILEEAEKLYNCMIKDLTGTIIDNTAFKMMSSPVPSDLPTRLRVHIQSYTYTKEDPEVNDNDNNNDDDDK